MTGQDNPKPRAGRKFVRRELAKFRDGRALGVSFSVALPHREGAFMFSPGKMVGREGPNKPPLCEIAPVNSPLAWGDAHNMLTEIAPTDSPKIVTFVGSPAKRRDIFPHPLQAGDLVEQTVVARNVRSSFRRRIPDVRRNPS